MKIIEIQNGIARAKHLSGTHDSAYSEVGSDAKIGDELPERDWVCAGDLAEHERLDRIFWGEVADSDK